MLIESMLPRCWAIIDPTQDAVRSHLKLSGQGLGRLGQERAHKLDVWRQGPGPLQRKMCTVDVHDQAAHLLGRCQVDAMPCAARQRTG